MREQRKRSNEDDLANDLASAHIELVQQIVTQVATRYPRHVDRSELWSAGAIGLVDASRSYNPETGVPFARYASIRIRGSIIDSTRKRDWAVRSLRRHMRELHDAEAHIAYDKGRNATDEEIAKIIGISTEEVHSRRSASAATGHSRSAKRSTWRTRSAKACVTPTRWTSSTGTSSRATSCSTRRAPPSWSISDSHAVCVKEPSGSHKPAPCSALPLSWPPSR